jgi:hypothetical protein
VKSQDAFKEELGKALADRMGLNHDSTLADWDSEDTGKGIIVKMTSCRYFTRAEYAELAEAASKRLLAGSEAP